MSRPFFLLVVLDGFGCRSEKEWNAIAQANAPTFHQLFATAPWTTVEASGLRVGLPEGQMGNSEVGHLNIGAGRVVDQDIVRISKAVRSHELDHNAMLVEKFASLKKRGRAVHLIGLLSDGGVHSLQEHLHGLIDAAVANGLHRDELPSIFVHAILDGRDTPPKSAIANLQRLQAFISGKADVELSTIIGRYYAMDRDKRWERVKRAYDLMTLGMGTTQSSDPIATIEQYYADGITDEFMEPIVLMDESGAHHGKICEGDTLIFFNFRADRMRQLIATFKDDDFSGFERAVRPRVELISMVRYNEQFTFPVIFPPQQVTNHLGEVLSREKLKQLRIAETEKYAHVTFFFNGGSDQASEGEERVLIPSAKVATYDLKPQMSVFELADRVVAEIESRKFDVVILNIANPDMVGHTGVMPATITAIEATDTALKLILDAVQKVDGVAMITADHGNAEIMFDPATGQPHTAHTSNPVPLILVDAQNRFGTLRDGGALENVAPTMLDLLGIARPAEMTGESLLVRASS
jgi:2,3-bisphosphoglycerate-independent phosphoglycerate mutase